MAAGLGSRKGSHGLSCARCFNLKAKSFCFSVDNFGVCAFPTGRFGDRTTFSSTCSNGSTLNRLDVVYSLPRFDKRCMKLDAGDATTFRLMNAASISLGRLVSDLRSVGHLTLQSMFVRDVEGIVDNTTPRAVNAWLDAVERVQPESVDLYSLARPPARGTLLRVAPSILEGIAARVTARGIPARVCA